MDNNQLVTIEQAAAVTVTGGGNLALAGKAANDAAAAWAFADYRGRKSANTLRNHDATLALFAGFLNHATGAALDAAALAGQPAAWHGVTWGIVEAFKLFMLNEGYAISAINNRLSTVKVYAGLASKAGVIPADELTLIKAVAGYGATEGKRVNQRRPRDRRGAKKAAAVGLTIQQARELKRPQAFTQQAARDAFMMALFLDHGLRLGELAALTVDSIDLETGLMTFYRQKVDKTQTHRLTAAALTAGRRYLDLRPQGAGPGLWVASDRAGRLLPGPMSPRAISKRVSRLGGRVGAVGLSPHDCRHYWATAAATGGTGVFNLRDAGGWASVAMPARYVEAAAIANDGVILAQ
jgi:integrase